MRRVHQVNQPFESLEQAAGIQGVQEEFIQLGHGCLDVFQLIQRVGIFGGGHPVQAAVVLVGLLDDGFLYDIQGLGRVRRGVMHDGGAAPHREFMRLVADAPQTVGKGAAHGLVREGDARVHGQRMGGRELPELEAGQPPVQPFAAHDGLAVLSQHEGHGQAFVVGDALVKGTDEFFRVNVFERGIVHTDFAAGSNAVLAFPQFDEPAFSPVEKGNGFAVHNHIEAGRGFVVQPAVTHFSLPAVHEGIEGIGSAVVGEAHRLQILVKLFLLSVFVGIGAEAAGADLPDDDNDKEAQEKCRSRADDNK